MSAIDDLRAKLIRNWNEVDLRTGTRAPHYDGIRSARLAHGTAAKKLGTTIDILPPGKRGCSYHHFHYAQEEMFVVACTARRTTSITGGGAVSFPCPTR